MQEMKLIDAVAAETAIKDFFKKQIDEEYLYLEVTDCNADISAILNALPEVPAVPLDVHERMKRELNEEIAKLKANNDRLTYCQVCEKCELETATNQHFCNKYGGYVSETDCCSRGNIKRNGG